MTNILFCVGLWRSFPSRCVLFPDNPTMTSQCFPWSHLLHTVSPGIVTDGVRLSHTYVEVAEAQGSPESVLPLNKHNANQTENQRDTTEWNYVHQLRGEKS